MDEYSLGFSVSNLGPKSFQKLVNKYSSSKKAWEGNENEFEKLEITGLTFKKFDKFRKEFDVVQYTRLLKKANVKFVSFFDDEYPKNFKKLENPPIGIFCKGNLSLLRHSDSPAGGEESNPKILRRAQDDNTEKLKIAVVGTRKITSYGRSVTEAIVSELSNNGVCIVSGLALGVDGLSHKVCLENQGATIAVMPCGVDCCLPSENYSIYSNILKNDGMIISEYPLSQPPNKGTFLARNRLIAALSDGVLVTEAAEDSGSLVTAEWGFRLSKKVFAVPGPINSQMAKGGLKLLKKGAKLVTDGQDILEEFEQNKKAKIKKEKAVYKSLNKEEEKIVSLLENEKMSIDDISKKTQNSCFKIIYFNIKSGVKGDN